MSLFQLVLLICILTLWTAALLRRDRFALPSIGPLSIRLTHALPAVLQITIFAYWSLYWSPVLAHLPVLGVQLVVAYVFEFLLAWSLRRPYRPSLAPVPIVLSAHLFVWFLPGDVLLYSLVSAIALASKALILRNGRHIFNPSVLGVAVVGSLCIVLPWFFGYRDISHDFARPPHMAQLILLLALIPQIRLYTAPVTLGAALAMVGTMLIVFSITGYQGGPSPWWPPWLLAVTLLAADPATIPSTPTARLLFGLFLGTAFYVVSRALLFSVGTDFFSKVIPIPLANYLVPTFERAGSLLSQRWPGLGREAGNRAYVVAWLAVSLLMLLVSSRA